jgi:hypothetical protein
MSETVGELQVKVTADTSALSSKIAQQSEASGKSFAKTFATVGAVAAGVGLAAAAVGTKFASGAITAAEAAATAEARLDQVAKSMGLVDGAYEGATQRAKDYASELSKQIAVDDNVILATQAKLATFSELGKTMNQTNGAFDRATKAAFDLAATGFGSAESNAIQLGKALQDPVKGITALARAGVTFSEEEKKLIKSLVDTGQAAKAQDMVLSALEKQVGGVAAATANASDKFSVAFNEMQETVGKALLPVFNDIVEKVIPIIESLAEPLSEIATVVGTALGDAFTTIAPLIGPLVEAFASLGGAVSGALVSALAALVPAVTPLLEIIGELAQRLGPLLEKVLLKVADVLVKVLSAVTPLLDPLIDLVFVILDAAWPIIEVVADVFLQLVDAIAPLLGVVGTLLKPVGELVQVLFAAIMPILKPVLPLIEALATVLADVLGRAIGVVMTAMGLWIKAMSKIAPFILNNLVQPVVKYFLIMVENIVGAAAEMFSWVPGLGDKLGEAKKAVADFKDNAEKGISQAADTIAREGERIGSELVDNGIAQIKDPASQRQFSAAGQSLGMAAADGMAIGIRNGQIPVQAASSALASTAISSAKSTLQSKSPSKVFIKIGGDVVDGFAIGLEGIDKVGEKFADKLGKAVKASEKRINEFVDKQKKALDDAVQAWKDYRNEVFTAITGNVNFADAFGQTEAQQKAVIAAQEALNEAKAKAAQPNASESDRNAVTVAEQKLAEAQAAVQSFEANLNTMLDQSEFFGAMFDKASTAMIEQFGADSPIWQMMSQQMLAAGPVEGAKLAQYIADNGLSPEMQDRLLNWDAWAGQVAKDQADKNKAQGIKMAENSLKGLKQKIKEERKSLVAMGESMGDGVVLGFKNKQGAFKSAVDGYIAAARAALQINSPSRVFAQIGEYTAEGFNQGMASTLEPFTGPDVTGGGVRMYAPSTTMEGAIRGGDVNADIRVFLGDKELTDLVDVQIQRNDERAMDLVIAGRRF